MIHGPELIKLIFAVLYVSCHAYCRILLHDTMLMKDSFRSGTSDTPLCHCGKAEESVEHFLLHCGNSVNDKKVLLDTVTDLAVSRSSE